jgi:hypothetical protein
MKKIISVSILAVIIFISCSKSGGTDGGTVGGGGGGGTTLNCSTVTNKAFAADVSPIISSTCAINAGCHAAGSGNGPGPLTNYTQIFNARTTIRSSVSSGSMPKNSTLTTPQKNSIICWIDSGAPNN